MRFEKPNGRADGTHQFIERKPGIFHRQHFLLLHHGDSLFKTGGSLQNQMLHKMHPAVIHPAHQDQLSLHANDHRGGTMANVHQHKGLLLKHLRVGKLEGVKQRNGRQLQNA